MKIAATSGCFDLIHAGHVYMFKDMRSLVAPDGLVVVFVNNDDYLLRTKGRVITPLEQRLQILTALENVDIAIPFKDDTPYSLIEIVQPKYWVKGSEYLAKNIPETQIVKSYGGELCFSIGGPDVHTTDILGQIYLKMSSGVISNDL